MSGALMVSRMGDTMTHGAHIVGGSPDMTVNDLPVVRLGDPVVCPQHGRTHIISGISATMSADGLYVARLGARAACGAEVIGGSSSMDVG